MRIRKRSAATSSDKLDLLHDSSNGSCLQPPNPFYKFSRGSQDPRSSPHMSPASIIKHEDPLLLGAIHRLSQKQLPAAKTVPLKREPRRAVVSSGVESCDDDTGSMIKRGQANPRAHSVSDMQHINEVMHMPMHDGDGDDDVKGLHILKGCEELGLQLGITGKGNQLSAACKKVMPNVNCKASVLHEEISMQADLVMGEASDWPRRKVRPLQQILSSDYSPATPPKLPLPLCTTGSSSTMPGMTPPLPARKLERATPPKLPLPLCPTTSSSTTPSTPPPLPACKFERALPSTLMQETPRLPSPAGGSLMEQTARDGEMRLIRNEDAASCSCSAQGVRSRAEFESWRLVPGWQGHRRARSHVRRGVDGIAAPGVNELLTSDPTEQTRKKPKGTQDFTSAASSPDLFLSTPAPACPHPISAKTIGSIVAAEAKPAANTPTHTCAYHVPPMLPAVASDHELRPDSMRCRRKDGRRWRCKEQVVKAGAPFCHYHTLKKYAASVVRKLSKQLQAGEVKISLSHADESRASTKRATKIRRLKSSPSTNAMRDGYGSGRKVASAVQDYEEADEEEAVKNEDGKQETQLAGKQQLQENAALGRRWRKKCKPCIRWLHDIHDRVRPAATDGLDWFNSCGEETSKEDSPPTRSRSPLPECLLNTNPYEWRSDFP